MIQGKLDCRSHKQKRKNQITRLEIERWDWFILPLLLSSPTIQFSLDPDQQSHKQNGCSATDSVRLIFNRSQLLYASDYDYDSVESENHPLADRQGRERKRGRETRSNQSLLGN